MEREDQICIDTNYINYDSKKFFWQYINNKEN